MKTENYNLPIGTQDISCAVKVGTGYSTNNSCTARACVGEDCATHPDTFSVVSSGNTLCTSQPNEEYNIGCNPDAPQSTQLACAAWFQNLFNQQATGVVTTFKARFTFNGANDEIGCTKYPPGGMPGGLNMYENFVCKKILPSGELVEIYAADNSGTPITSLQTTSYTTRLDTQKPHLDLKYYKEPARINLITDIDQWQKSGVTAEAICTDLPNDESTYCSCAKTIDPSTTDANSWSSGIISSLGADVVSYTRTFVHSLTSGSFEHVAVSDTAYNVSQAQDIAIGIDTQAPTVTVTGTNTLTIDVSDSDSKIWPAGIITKKVPLANIANPGALFDDSCEIANPLYTKITDTASLAPSIPSKTVTISSSEVVNYCVQDNA